MSKVYVTHENVSLDYSMAEQFGELQFLTASDFSAMKASIHNLNLLDELRYKVSSFNPEEDFIIATGSPIVNAAVFMMLGRVTKTVKLLRWSNRDRVYTPIVLDIP